MQDNSKNLIILGPLSMEISVKTNYHMKLSDEIVSSKKNQVSYGGSCLKILRILYNLGYDLSYLYTYIGSDDLGSLIQNKISEEHLKIIIQKLPLQSTPISILLHNNESFSYMIKTTKDLSLWMLRIKQLQIGKNDIVYLDPSIPGEIQSEIVETFPKTQFVLRKPIDNNLSIFSKTKNLTVILNEYEAFQIACCIKSYEYSVHNVLTSNEMKKHNVFIETKSDVYMLDSETQNIKKIDIHKKRKQYSITNELFIGACMAGIASAQEPEIAFLWGLFYAVHHYDEQISKKNIITQVNKLKWEVV